MARVSLDHVLGEKHCLNAMYAGCDLAEYERGEFDFAQYKRAGLDKVPNAVRFCRMIYQIA